MPSAVPDIFLLVILGTSVWVGVDANSRDWTGTPVADRTWKWVLGTLVLWVIVFPIYLMKRGDVPRKT